MPTSLARFAVATSIVILAAAACSSHAHSGSSSGGCGGGGQAAYTAAAKVVFIAVMLPGATAHTGSGDILTSPAKARVIHYLKGTGPSLVTIDTGISKDANGVSGNEDGIEPKAGQRWRIYSGTQTMPYQTSICMGSVLVSGSQP